MVKLFDIDRGQVVMNPTCLWIPEFKTLWDRDKSKSKAQATREITYIVFLHSFQSPYQVYADKIREEKILNDYFKDTPKWKPDKEVKAAIDKYLELQDSLVLKLLRSTKMALETIESFFASATVDDIDKIVKHAEKLGSLVQSLDKLEKQVQSEQSERSSRGGTTIGLFEV